MPKLYKHQKDLVDNAKDKQGLWLRMRVGKTPTTIRLMSTRVTSGLIICPKSILKQWEQEIDRWNDNQHCKFIVITRDQFKKQCHTLPKCEAIAIDECHRGFGNFKSQMFKAAMGYIKHHSVEYIWLLSGTPYTATSWSIYSYGLLLGRAWKWYQWKQSFFVDIMMGRRRIPIARKDKDQELQSILRSLGTVIDIKDVMEVVEDEDIIEYFGKNKQQNKHIKDLEDVLPIVRYCKIHQLESGVLKSDGYSEALLFECDKDKRLKELVEDNPKIVIVVRYLQQIEKYKKMFTGTNLYAISGQEKQTASEVAERANAQDKAVLLIQSDTCDGYSLKSFSLMVFVSLSYSFVNYDQMKFRMKDISKQTPNTYIHFLTDGDSLDKAVFKSVSNKKDFSEALYGKEKI